MQARDFFIALAVIKMFGGWLSNTRQRDVSYRWTTGIVELYGIWKGAKIEEHFMQIITECSDNWSDYEFVNLIGTVIV